MTDGNINKFNILLINNGVKENEELKLVNNPEIRELLEDSPFDAIIDEIDKVSVLYTLHLLTHNLNDNIARKILASKLNNIYETGDLDLINSIRNLGYFGDLSIDDLLFIIFESKSLFSHNFLTSLEQCSLSVDSIKDLLIELSKDDKYATMRLLISSFLTMGSIVRTDYRFRDALSKWHIWKLFNFFKDMGLRYDQYSNEERQEKL